MKKTFWLFSVGFMLVFFGSFDIYATASASSTNQINIDGNFSDWDNVTKTKVGYGPSYYNEAAIIDGNTLYVYVDSSYSWGDIPTWGGYTISVNGRSYSANFNGNSSNLTTTGSLGNTNFGNVGTGIEARQNNGQTNMFEFSYSLSKVGVSDIGDQGVTVSNSSMGPQVVNAKRIETSSVSDSASSASSSNTSSSTSLSNSSSFSANNNGTGEYKVGRYNIVIDGNFSDWAGIRKTDLTRRNGNGNIKHAARAAMVSDGTNLYIYVQMNYTNNFGYNHLETDGYHLTVGGIPYYFFVRSPNSISLSDSLRKLGDKTALKIVLGSNYRGNYYVKPSNIEAQAARIANNAGFPTDTMEIKIPLSDFSLSSQSGQIITLRNWNLGHQTITVSGGSTGPIILAVIGLVVALLGLWKFEGFKKKGWVNR